MGIFDPIDLKGKLTLWAGAVAFLMITVIPASSSAGNVEQGEKIATTRKLGNCVACHYLPNVESPGDIGPNLVEAMQEYTMADRDDVAQWIRDAREFNPGTIMPPFGTNKILTPEQIDDLVAYLYTLKK
ncbi:MAG TPA: sulfur oxidation c-type cytochrome SoxX [Desulfobulbus sp.]|nr:sulfur oxidation c-type cytochrome SoxX [Desulfobulbus sp.]